MTLSHLSGLAFVGLLATAGSLRSQEPTADPQLLTDTIAASLDAEAAEIAAQLRCPVCRGQSVLESNSTIAQEMQAVIREKLGQGENEEQILSYFVGSYGDWIILKPRAIGLNLLVYVLPAIGLVFGTGWLIVLFKKWSAGAATAASQEAPSGLDDEDERWLRDAMRRE